MSEKKHDSAWDALLRQWPNCPTPDCEYKVCTWARTGLCHPCSVRRLGKAQMDELYEQTHPSPVGAETPHP